jgi:hypothetical protein
MKVWKVAAEEGEAAQNAYRRIDLRYEAGRNSYRRIFDRMNNSNAVLRRDAPLRTSHNGKAHN